MKFVQTSKELFINVAHIQCIAIPKNGTTMLVYTSETTGNIYQVMPEFERGIKELLANDNIHINDN